MCLGNLVLSQNFTNLSWASQTCQINFRHFGHISQFALHKYHFSDKTHYIEECTQLFTAIQYHGTIEITLNHLIKSLTVSDLNLIKRVIIFQTVCYKFQTDHQCKNTSKKVKVEIQLVTAQISGMSPHVWLHIAKKYDPPGYRNTQ